MKFASPVVDLHDYIWGATDRQFRQKEFHHLIKYYYAVLSQQIRRLGSDPSQLFPYRAFEDHLKRFSIFAFLIAPIRIEVLLAGEGEFSDLDELATKISNGDDNISLVTHQSEETRQLYRTRLGDIFDDLIALGYDFWI